MALCSSSCSTFSVKSSLLSQKPSIFAWSKRHLSFRLTRATDNVAEVVGSTAVEKKIEAKEESSPPVLEKKEEPKGAVATTAVPNFKNPRWVGGTWDLTQFAKDGKTDWDAIIDAEARRRKCKPFL